MIKLGDRNKLIVEYELKADCLWNDCLVLKQEARG